MPAGTRFKLRVCTWNVGNAQPPSDLAPWLGIGQEDYDIIVVGAQEANYSPERNQTPTSLDSSTTEILDVSPSSDPPPAPTAASSAPSSASKRLRKLSRALWIATGVRKDPLVSRKPLDFADSKSLYATTGLLRSDSDRSEEESDEVLSFRLQPIRGVDDRKEIYSGTPTLRKARSDLSQNESIGLRSSPKFSNQTTPRTFDDLDESLLVKRRENSNIGISPEFDGDVPVVEDLHFYGNPSFSERPPLSIARKLLVEEENVHNGPSDDQGASPTTSKTAPTAETDEQSDPSLDPPPIAKMGAIMEDDMDSEISPASIQCSDSDSTNSLFRKPSVDAIHARLTRKVREHIASPKPWSDDLKASTLPTEESNSVTSASTIGRNKFERTVERNMPPEYHLIAKHHLMEIKLLIFVHERHSARVVKTERVAEATGLGNVVGNKGGVAVKLTLDDTTFCFVSSHLAAHEGAKFLQQRNADVCEIMRNIDRSRVHGLPAIHQSDHLFWLGDLNYRLDLKRILPAAVTWSHAEKWGYVTELIARRRFEDLVLFDELIHEMENQQVFAGFVEGRIRFAPTFKVNRGRTHCEYQTTRVPSYCDRILWHSLPMHKRHIRLKEYDCVPEFDTSDHKPVFAVFDVVIPKPVRLYGLPAPRHTLKCTIDFITLRLHGLYEKRATDADEPARYEILHDGALALAAPRTPGAPVPNGSPSHTRRVVRADFHGGGLFLRERTPRAEVPLSGGGVREASQDALPKIALRAVERMSDLAHRYVTVVFTRLGSKQGSSAVLPLARLVRQPGRHRVAEELELTKYGHGVAKVFVEAELVASMETWIDSRNKVVRVKGR